MIRFIYNPKSGKIGKNRRLAPLLREFVAASRGNAELVATERPGHATVLAAEAAERGYDRVIAVGGDGTLNETAQALLHSSTALGLIPCGSGNGLARHLHLPLQAEAALRLAVSDDAAVRVIDTGSANGKPFFNVMGLGLEADVAWRFNHLKSRGLATYVKAAWSAFSARVPEVCTVTDGHHREKVNVFFLCVANSDQWGNNARIAPGAQVDDGKLDLVAVAPRGWLGAAGLATRLFTGSVLRAPGVRHWRGGRFQIERVRPGIIHTDGETHELGTTIEIVVVPSSLRVLVPATEARRAAQARGFALQL